MWRAAPVWQRLSRSILAGAPLPKPPSPLLQLATPGLHLSIGEGEGGVHGENTPDWPKGAQDDGPEQSPVRAHSTPLGRAAAHPGFSVRPPKVAFCQRFSGRRLGRGSPEERAGGVSWGRGLAERAGVLEGQAGVRVGGGPARGPGGGGARSLRQRGCVWWERKSLCCRPIALGAEAGEGAPPLPHSQPPPPLRAKFTPN